jgi:putative transposase
MQNISFKRHRLPPEIIRHAVWIYSRYTLSYRDVVKRKRGRLKNDSRKFLRSPST